MGFQGKYLISAYLKVLKVHSISAPKSTICFHIYDLSNYIYQMLQHDFLSENHFTSNKIRTNNRKISG
jgi:hypothetical protein